MTPLEMALSLNDCKNLIKVRGAFYCKATGKILIPEYMENETCYHAGRCQLQFEVENDRYMD